MRKAHFKRDAFGCFFMCAIAVAVHENNCNAAQPFCIMRKQLLFQERFIKRLQHLTLRANALLGFNNRAVQQLGQHNVPIKKAWPVLVGDAQRIAKA